jgi:anti-sigma B factor antagonist
MSLRTSREGDAVVIGIEGQLVAGNRQQLREAVLNEIEHGARSIVIDFADTGYVDSAGLGVLVSLSKRIREASASLRLVNLNEDLRTLFELTRLDTLFDLGDRTDGSAASLADRPPAPRPGPDGASRRTPDDEARP